MSTKNLQSTSTLSLDDTTKDLPKRNWFSKRRRSLFSSQRKSKKKQDSNSLCRSEDLPPSFAHLSLKEQLSDDKSIRKQSIEKSNATNNGNDILECPLCFMTRSAELFPTLSTCNHRSCSPCLHMYLSTEISESRVGLTCPVCPEKLRPSDVRMILGDESPLLYKWEDFLLVRVLSSDPDCRWCPAPDCGYAVIAYGCASCPRLTCARPGCNTEFCYHCRQVWHHNQTCDSAHLQRTRQLRMLSNSTAFVRTADEVKPCPKCGALIIKVDDGSCNHMTCVVCETEFCWLCLQEITDLHYLSPSGCTFWGKKPWSKKKKILWQLGLLVGAPLGVGLVAGVAVPVITLGLPFWAGRKVAAKCNQLNLSRGKKIAAVGGSVVAVTSLSPILAALAVSIGVPVMLLYIYCVVPFSFCRSGKYGMRGQRAGNYVPGLSLPSPFRLDLRGTGAQPTIAAQVDDGSVLAEQSSRLVATNPSIGEASVGGLTMGSFDMSHAGNFDKMSRPDHDEASTVAMAGTSLTGSVSGISGAMTRVELHISDPDQASIQTHVSFNSFSGVTSVQVHAVDNVSEHSITSIAPGGHVRRTSIPTGSRRKTHLLKRSASVKVPLSERIHSPLQLDRVTGDPVSTSIANEGNIPPEQAKALSNTLSSHSEPRPSSSSSADSLSHLMSLDSIEACAV